MRSTRRRTTAVVDGAATRRATARDGEYRYAGSTLMPPHPNPSTSHEYMGTPEGEGVIPRQKNRLISWYVTNRNTLRISAKPTICAIDCARGESGRPISFSRIRKTRSEE